MKNDRLWLIIACLGGCFQKVVVNLFCSSEYLDLWEAAEHTVLTDQLDRTVWRWTPDGTHSAKSTYTMLHAGSIPFQGHALI
jgi:hypothetical protein